MSRTDKTTIMWNTLSRIWNARKVIKQAAKFYPWDYTFIVELEKVGYLEMINYLEKYGHLQNCEIVIHDLKLATRLIDIVLESDSAYDVNDKHEAYLTKYVNTKNWKRFLKIEPRTPALIDGLRIQKALYLYCKLRYYKLFTWWD